MENENLKNEEPQTEAQETGKFDAEEEINPADLIFNDDEMGNDADMPEPETHHYENHNDEKLLELKPMFYRLFYQSLGSMPSNTMFTNEAKQQISISKLMGFINAKIDADQTTMKVSDMNTILSFMLTAPMNQMQQLADLVANNQGKLWKLLWI